ncbi:gliding motility-associated C-terminal domain-containing protein [Hymenobacter humi]|uniref:Gliding motility-associated C-terminal domain-containing protein n=1 Tax=Hymenobacter humi TaxID=1411620 RepID=A0ABW2U341_9BACT
MGVSGSAATGFVFTPPANFSGAVSLTYTVTRGGCTATATRRISVAVPPTLQASWQPVACPETRLAPLTLRFAVASSSGSAAPSVVWDFGDGSQSTEISPTHTYATPGLYQPRVLVRYNQDRCDITVNAPPVEVKARNIPNIITPNGDGQNQTFKIGPDCVPRLQVFSRWGQNVFESAAYHDEWNAHGQPAGVYYYLLSYPDGHRLKGWVEVVR